MNFRPTFSTPSVYIINTKTVHQLLLPPNSSHLSLSRLFVSVFPLRVPLQVCLFKGKINMKFRNGFEISSIFPRCRRRRWRKKRGKPQLWLGSKNKPHDNPLPPSSRLGNKKLTPQPVLSRGVVRTRCFRFVLFFTQCTPPVSSLNIYLVPKRNETKTGERKTDKRGALFAGRAVFLKR